jgi:hypothetical protein
MLEWLEHRLAASRCGQSSRTTFSTAVAGSDLDVETHTLRYRNTQLIWSNTWPNALGGWMLTRSR